MKHSINLKKLKITPAPTLHATLKKEIFIRLFYECCLTVPQLLSLNIEDVDIEKKCLVVHISRTRYVKKNLSEECINLFELYLLDREGTGPLFCDQNQQRLVLSDFWMVSD